MAGTAASSQIEGDVSSLVSRLRDASIRTAEAIMRGDPQRDRITARLLDVIADVLDELDDVEELEAADA